MAEIYKKFVPSNIDCTFSDKDARELFEFESTGKGDFKNSIFGVPPFNGYMVGKHWMDITIGMWVEDKWKYVDFDELYKEFPEWFLKKIG